MLRSSARDSLCRCHRLLRCAGRAPCAAGGGGAQPPDPEFAAPAASDRGRGPADPGRGHLVSAPRLSRRRGRPRRTECENAALLVHGGIDVRISIDAEKIGKWTGEVMGGRSTEGWHYCLLLRRLPRALVRKRRTAVLIHRIVFVVQSRVHCDIWTSPSNESPWRKRSMRLPLAPPRPRRARSRKSASLKTPGTMVMRLPASAAPPTQCMTFAASP
jgi:hypothetical protein